MIRMNNCFEFFNDMQKTMEKNAIAVIVYHLRIFAKFRSEQRKATEKFEKKSSLASPGRKKTNSGLTNEPRARDSKLAASKTGNT